MTKKGNSMIRHVMPVNYCKKLQNGAAIKNKSQHNQKEKHKKPNRIFQHSLQKDEKSPSERYEEQRNTIINDSNYVNPQIKKPNNILGLKKSNNSASILPKSAIKEQSVCTMIGGRKNIINVNHYGSGDSESTEKDKTIFLKNMGLTGKKIWKERLWKKISFRRMSLPSVKSKSKVDIFTEKNTLFAKGGFRTESKSEIPFLKDYLVLHSNCQSINTNQDYSNISLGKDVLYCRTSVRVNQDIQQNSKSDEILNHKCINWPVIIFPEIENKMQNNSLFTCLQFVEYLASKLCRSGANSPISDCNKKSSICHNIHVVKSKCIDALTKVKDKCNQPSNYLKQKKETFLKMENDVSIKETHCQTMKWDIEGAKSNKKQVHQCEQVSKSLINIYNKRRRALPPNDCVRTVAETIKEKQFIGNDVEKNLKHNKANTKGCCQFHDDCKCGNDDTFERSTTYKACGDINEPKVHGNNVKINSYDFLTSHIDCECMNAKMIKSTLIPTLSKDFKQPQFTGKNVKKNFKKNLANCDKCFKLHDVCRCTKDEAFIEHTKISETCKDYNQKVIANALKNNSNKCFKSHDDCDRTNDEINKSSKISVTCKNIKQKVFSNHVKKNLKDNKANTKECSKLQDDCRCINVKPFQSTKIFKVCENLNQQQALDNFLKINANHWFKSHIDCECTNKAIIEESSKRYKCKQKQDFSNPVLKNTTDKKANIKECIKLPDSCRCKIAKPLKSIKISKACGDLNRPKAITINTNESLKLHNHCKCINAKIIEPNEICSACKNFKQKQVLRRNERLKTHGDSICRNVVGLRFKKVANGYRGLNLNQLRSGPSGKNIKKNTNEYLKSHYDCKVLNDGIIESCKICRTREIKKKKDFVKKNQRHNKATTNECSKLQDVCRCINTDAFKSSKLSEACGDVNQHQDVVNHLEKNTKKCLNSDNNFEFIHSEKIESSHLPIICNDIKQIDVLDKNVQKNLEGKRVNIIKRWFHCNCTPRRRPKRKSNVAHCKAKSTNSDCKRDPGTLEISTHKKKYRRKIQKHVRMRSDSNKFLQVLKFNNCNIRKDAIKIAVVKSRRQFKLNGDLVDSQKKCSDVCKNKNINKCVRSSIPRFMQYSTCLSPKIITNKEQCGNNSAKDFSNTRNRICSLTGPIKYKNYHAETTKKKIVCCRACSTNFPKQCYKSLPSCNLSKNKHIEPLSTRKKSSEYDCKECWLEPHCSRLPSKCKSAWKGTWREGIYCAFQCLCKKFKNFCYSESKCTYKSGNNKKHTELNDFNCNDLLFLNTPTHKPLFRKTCRDILNSCCMLSQCIQMMCIFAFCCPFILMTEICRKCLC